MLRPALVLPLLVALPVFAAGEERSPAEVRADFTYGRAVVTGVVEGVTEYLPVSSTGHMILSDGLICNVNKDPNVTVQGVVDRKGRAVSLDRVADDYLVIIQLGAILAVVVAFFGRLRGLLLGVVRGERASLRLAFAMLVAFLPAGLLGFLFKDAITAHLFSVEVVAVALVVGGLAILGCAFTRDFWPFFLLMLVHCLLYVPTISITNSIAFANMKNPEKEFGLVRMGGTIGWILAAWPFTFIFVNWDAVNAAHPAGAVKWLEAVFSNPLTGDAAKAATKWTYIVAGLASLALAAFSLTLPRSAKKPAVADGTVEKLAWLEALKLLKHPFILVLWLVTLADSFVHNCYFNWKIGRAHV